MRLRGERGNILEIRSGMKSGYKWAAEVAIYSSSSEAVPLASAILAQEDLFDLYGMFDAGAAFQFSREIKSEAGVTVGAVVKAAIETDPDYPGDPVCIASHWSLTVYAEGRATALAGVHLAKWQGNVVRNWLNSFVYHIIDGLL